MNENHALCSTPEWAEFMESEVLEPVTAGVDLGDEMLEIGPGPGAATRWLRHRVERLVALEFDPRRRRAPRGRARRHERHGRGRRRDAARPSPTRRSTPSAASRCSTTYRPRSEQFPTLCEAFRVLRPGGVLVGADSLASQGLHEFHEGDTYNPIDPARLLVFLQAAGFGHVMVSAGEGLLFTARKSPEERSCE